MCGGQSNFIPEAALPYQSSDTEGGGERKSGEQDQRTRKVFEWRGRGGA